MAKVFLFRHAQSIDGAHNVFSGWRDPDLTGQGIEESKEIQRKLAAEKPTKAYTSDLRRCVHTLQVVLEPHENVEVFEDARLRERDYGDLSGQNKNEVAQKYPKDYPIWHRSYDIPPPGGESIKDVSKRVSLFIEDLLKSLKPDDTIFICAHGNSMRPIRKRFEKMTEEEMVSFEHPPAEVYSYVV